MRKFYFVTLIGLSFSLLSCVTVHNVTLDTLQSATVTLPSNIQRVVFLYNTSAAVAQNYDDAASIVADTLLAHHLLQGAIDKLAETPYIVPAVKCEFQSIKPSILRLKLDSLCNDYDADAVVIVNQYRWNNNLSEVAHYISDYDMYYASQVVLVQADWKVYSRYTQQYVDQYIQRDTSYWEAWGNNSVEATQKLPILHVAVPSALYSSGGRWAVRYTPSWISSKRFYYETSNKKMRQASNLALQNDWIGAAKIWTEIVYNSKSSKMLTAKAAFNMALAAEMADNIDAALDWAAKSYFYYNDTYTSTYLQILERRKEVKKKLESLYPSTQE